MTDLTVKYFSSGMVGAPQIANNWGDLVTMLDACLVNGFALKAIDSLTFANGVATASITAGHAYLRDQVVLIAGANVVRFAPAPIVSEAEVQKGLDRFERACERFLAGEKS